MSQTGAPGRYSRSFGGLVGAMIVVVLGTVVFVLLRGCVTDPQTFEATPVDYREAVAEAQAGGLDVVYPAALPQGWRATDVDLEPPPEAVFGLSVLTAEDQYVGLRVEDQPLPDLLRRYVDESYREADPITVQGSVARRWQGFADDGGDSAYAAEVDGRTVLVYGSAPASSLAAVVSSLTDVPVAETTSSSR